MNIKLPPISVPARLDEEKCKQCIYSHPTTDGWCYMFKHKPIYVCSKFKETK